MNVIARLEYELAYYDSAVHRFNHYTTRTPLKLVEVKDQTNCKKKKKKKKKKMYVDYSEIISLYTQLDAYPLPRIDKMINDLAKYKVFSSFDLKNANHPVLLKVSDRKYWVFEANDRLFQFYRMPFVMKDYVPESHRQNTRERKYMWCCSLYAI